MLQKFKDDLTKRNTEENKIIGNVDYKKIIKDPDIVQRLYKFNYDIRDILKFWRINFKTLKEKKGEIKNLIMNKEEDGDNRDHKIFQKVNKKEIGVKYDFKQPESQVKKLIPLCNDIFTIAKNEQ